MSKTKNQNLWSLLGCLIVVLAIYSAMVSHYKNFYEFLVVGLFLTLRPLVDKSLNKATYLSLYLIFFIAGIICDLVMGIYITGLWRYNYNHLWEYAILYLFIYPFAGIVMVQSYIVVKIKLLKLRNRGKKKPLFNIQAYKRAGVLLVTLLALDIVLVLTKATPANLISFFVLASLLAFLLLSYVSQLHGHNTVIEDIHRHPIKGLLLLLSATYLNALLHEVPNTFAQQWVYTNWPLSNVRFADIPIAVLLLWPLLLLIPVAGYYFIVPNKSRIKNKATLRKRTT